MSTTAESLLRHPVLRTLVSEARRRKLELYLVGGVVRARLAFPEAEVNNADLLLLGDVRSFANGVAQRLKSKAIVINPHFDTVLVPAHGIEFEISAPRTLKTEHRGKLDLPDDPLRRDLLLRDFTIDAIAEPLHAETPGVIDPAGGAQDLKARLIRTPIPARITLEEDPLRILRAARLAAQLNFSLDPELLQAMHRTRELLTGVAAERKTAELLKILQSDKPSLGLKILYVTGVLDVAFPDLAALAAMKPDRKPRHKDVFEHTMMVVDTVARSGGNLETRLAALLHDIGKPATRRWDPAEGWTFHGHEVVGERMSRRLGREWKLPSATVANVARLVRLHMRPINLSDEEVTDSAVRRLRVQAGDDVDRLLLLCRADVTSSDPTRVKRYLANFERVVDRLRDVDEKDQLRAFQSPVRGDIIMTETGLEPGPLVGKLKTMIEEAILDGVIPNDYEAALKYLRQIKDSVLQEESQQK